MTQPIPIISSAALPTTVDSHLQAIVWCSSNSAGVMYFHILQTDLDGNVIEYTEKLVIAARLAPYTLTVQLTKGYLQTVTMWAPAAQTPIGQLFVRLQLLTGAVQDDSRITPLTSGYVASGSVLSYPLSIPQDPFSPTVRPLNIGVTTPPIEEPIDFTFFEGNITELLAWTFYLVTGPNPGPCLVTLTISVDSLLIASVKAATAQGIGTTCEYNLWFGDSPPANTATRQWLKVPPRIPEGLLTLHTSTTNNAAGEQFATGDARVYQWINPY